MKQISKNAKLAVVAKAAILFGLTPLESENLSNKAGLLLCARKNGLREVFEHYDGTYRELLQRAAVSERMFQYYMAGKEPTKQALLAIGIALEPPLDRLADLLHSYGYCISRSLPNDAIVMWFLTNCQFVPITIPIAQIKLAEMALGFI